MIIVDIYKKMQPQLTPIYLKISTKLKGKLQKEAKKHRVSMVKFITDAGVRTYQRSAATYNAVTNTFHSWAWGSSPFGPQSTRDVTFDCN